MSEKTAEEKLRQALEGSVPDSNSREQPISHKKPRPSRARPKAQSRSTRENLGERLDSFMDDFERRIEQSINAVKSPSESPKHHESLRRVKISAEHKPETLQKIPETPKEIPEPLPEVIPATPEPEPEPAQEIVPPEPEILPEPEISQPAEEPLKEEITPDVIPAEEETEPELPEIPVIEAAEVPHDEEGNLPDIPVIVADNEEEIDDSAEIFADELEELSADDGSENPGHEENDETEKESPVDFQEAELTEAPGTEDDFAEIDIDNDAFNDVPLDEEPESPGDFSPPADVVLSVDEEIPQKSAPAEDETDPESESVPVTVTMPESTKTAEDKLMADIAEAMTGNPLSLDSQETPAYNLPENFFTDGSSSGSPQSAEDKLKANIVEALSESPIDTAQNQANQNLEEDISPFEELSVPETVTSPEEELPPEEPTYESEPLPEESHDEEESTPDFDAVTEDDSGTQNAEDDGLNDPFTIPDFGDDETESEPVPEMNLESAEDETKFFTEAFTQESDETQEPELMPEIEPESEPEISAEPEESQPEQETSTNDEEMPFPVEESRNDAPMTEQEALIAMLNQEFEPEDNTNEEAEQENNMPEQSLLNDETPGTFEPEENNDDDFDISSLGEELGQAAVIAGDDSDDFSALPGTVTEMITEPENFTASAGAAKTARNPEDDHKEKTMSIREKLASRKNGNTESSPAGKKSGGLLLTILTAALAIIGGLILWQLMTVSDKITSLAMNAPGYESSAGAEIPSYDYAIDFILDPNLSDRMAQRGRGGWQVVGSRRTQDSTTGQYGYEFIFMRRTPGR